MALSLSPDGGTDGLVRKGDRCWFHNPDPIQEGSFKLMFAVLCGLPVAHDWFWASEDDQWGWPISVFAMLVVLPVLFISVRTLMSASCYAMLDLAKQEFWRVHWRTGELLESRPTNELWLRILRIRDLSEDVEGDTLKIYISDSDGAKPEFDVFLYGGNSSDCGDFTKTFKELKSHATWKGVCGDIDVIEGRSARRMQQKHATPYRAR